MKNRIAYVKGMCVQVCVNMNQESAVTRYWAGVGESGEQALVPGSSIRGKWNKR